ncbi:MAG: SGNH/GDSL hydrolase family protein [Saprospirales bacterium]|nr:SGNH/GDSL hydrolase family protein [Saprospirales bacterium]
MKKTLKGLVFITLPTLIFIFVILELFFRYVIPAAEIPQGVFDENELLYRFDTTGQREGVYTMGKGAEMRGDWRINNHGWNAPNDYFQKKDKKLIAVIGDSFIEAMLIDIDKSYPFLLRDSLGSEYDVYAIAKSGAPLSEYLSYSRYANKYFNPDIFIFNVVHNDYDESILELNPSSGHRLTVNVGEEGVTENVPVANPDFSQFDWKKRTLKKSAIFRYLYSNLNITKAISMMMEKKKEGQGDEQFNANVEVAKLLENKDAIDKAVGYILAKIKEENPGKKIIFIMDAPREDIYKGRLAESNVMFLHDILKDHCQKNGFVYHDLTQPMQEDYLKNKTRFNPELDAHWDEYGHRFVFNQIMAHPEWLLPPDTTALVMAVDSLANPVQVVQK